MDIREAFQSSVGDFGLYVPVPGQSSSDNGVLWTTEYYLILKRLGILTADDVTRCKELLSQCVNCGLTLRKPGDHDLDSPDNMVAFAVASAAFDLPYAQMILDYGRSTFPHYVYNVPNPGKFTFQAWLGRQLGLIGFLRICAGYKASILQRLALTIGIYLTSRKSHSDVSDKLLAQLMTEQLPDNSVTKRFWNRYVHKEYGSVNTMVRLFFDPSSPFTQYWT